MRIFGVFNFYDESPSWLGTAISGLGRLCDHIVAIDGAYALYPEGKPKSSPDQIEAILHGAEVHGSAITLHQPDERWWGNEVEKRNKFFDIIGAFAEDGDWLVIFDADCHVQHCQPDSVRHELANTDCEVATYGLREGEDWLALENPLAVETKIQSSWITKTRDIYRWNPTLRIGPAHGDYSIQAGYGHPRDGERLWLRGPYELEEAHDVSPFLVVHHRTKSRALVRREAQQGYYHMRDSLGIEDQSEVLA